METEIKFPYYCCFGKLVFGSVIESSNVIRADYQMFGINVHRLIFLKDSKSWRIEDYYPHNQRIRLSSGSTLERAICIHMLYLKGDSDPLVELLKQKLSEYKNISLSPFPVQGQGLHTATSPAGKLMLIRLILHQGKGFPEQMKKLKLLPSRVDTDSYFELRLLSLYESAALYPGKNEKIEIIPCYVAEFMIPVAFLYDSIRWINTYILQHSIKNDRIIIEDAGKSSKTTLFELECTKDGDKIMGFFLLKGLMEKNLAFRDTHLNLYFEIKKYSH